MDFGANSADSSASINYPSINALQIRFGQFVQTFREGNNFVYRSLLSQNLGTRNYSIDIRLSDIFAFDELLGNAIQQKPDELLPSFENVLTEMSKEMLSESEREVCGKIQLNVLSGSEIHSLRDIGSKSISKLVRISGIVVSASNIASKPVKVYIICRSCRSHQELYISEYSSFSLPRSCPNSSNSDVGGFPCPIDPFVVLPDKTQFVDIQTLKIQELPDSVPVGELPRHVLVTVDRNNVNRVVPGTRVEVTGVFSIRQVKSGKNSGSTATIRTPFIKAVGILFKEDKQNKGLKVLTSEDESRFIELSRTPNLYETFSKSIAPSIFGSDDIKKAILCLLFGGTRKFLPDNIRIRGDVNVLLLGDPGTAKSQFLKFVEKVAPTAVYTSGKGSSAAGLTASVIRDPSTGEFYLEGGAMVLADGGVVCIDEFDKMRDEDRVAIHEAMEQQTISIAKAGITTILNSRTSVLAAANPIFGRYDDLRSPGENIDFSSTILSRFDMIFIVKDEHDKKKDSSLAKHVLSVHMNVGDSVSAASDIDINLMRDYIRYCRSKCAPRLTSEAAERLVKHYVTIRSDLKKAESGASERSSIPITIRQLEAVIRIAESLAKLTLSISATVDHVEEALRLFRVSTIQAVNAGHNVEGVSKPGMMKDVEKAESIILKRLPIGSSASHSYLMKELVQNRRISEQAALYCIDVMVQQGRLLYRNNRRTIVRQP